MNEIKHRDIEYKAKEAMRYQYTSHRTSLPTFEGVYENEVLQMAHNIYHYISMFHGESKARHWCYTVNLDPEKYINE